MFPPRSRLIICSSSTALHRTTSSTCFTTHNKQTPMESIMRTLQGGEDLNCKAKANESLTRQPLNVSTEKVALAVSRSQLTTLCENTRLPKCKRSKEMLVFFCTQGTFLFSYPPTPRLPREGDTTCRFSAAERDKTTQTV